MVVWKAYLRQRLPVCLLKVKVGVALCGYRKTAYHDQTSAVAASLPSEHDSDDDNRSFSGVT